MIGKRPGEYCLRRKFAHIFLMTMLYVTFDPDRNEMSLVASYVL